tara:strand:- start:1505 stop:1972 length:468 start_codon:yes stop_codon:yes gene_type:complete
MEYYNTITKKHYTFHELREAHEDLRVIAFTETFTVKDWNPNFVEVTIEGYEDPGRGKKAVRDGVQVKDGKYYDKYKIVDKTDDEKKDEDNRQLNNALQDRDNKLLKCDWTQLPDTALSAEKVVEFKEYRKLLRDITKDSNWPWTHKWPSEPKSKE